jgi:hypothetical protein
MSQITKLKDKLTFSRMKKTDTLIRRDITSKLGEKAEKFNAKGFEIYGESWASGDVSVRDMVSVMLRREMLLLKLPRTKHPLSVCLHLILF